MKAIHETVIRDIIDLTTEIKDTDSIGLMRGKAYNKNIATSASAYTMVFPVLVDRSIAIENASMVTKAQERNTTSMMQMLFTANTISTGKDAGEHVRKFHQNLDIGSDLTVDGMMTLMDKYVFESTMSDMEARKLVTEEYLKNDGYYLEDNINETALIDYTIIPSGIYGSAVVTEAKANRRHKSNRDNKKPSIPDPSDAIIAAGNKTRDYIDLKAGQIERSTAVITGHQNNEQLKQIKGLNAELKNSLANRANTMNNAKDAYGMMKTNSETIRNMLLDTDVKKANELTPTLMTVNIIIPKEEYSIPITLVLGIKCKMHALDTMDIVDRLVSKSVDKNFAFKFIKATTKEISFMKDFLFAIDRAKIDALSQSRKGSSSKLWKVLERRALKGRIKRRLAISNDAMAITTLTVNQTTIDYIKKEYNIDLENPKEITPIMDSLNLLCFCIVDEVNEVTKWIYDTGEDLYEYLSFTNLERETSDGGYKKVVNLLSKSMR